MAFELADEASVGRLSTIIPVMVAVTVVGLLAIVSITGVVIGAEDDISQAHATGYASLQESAQICGQSTDPLVTSYNRQITEVPWFVKTAVGGKVIHGVVHNDPTGDYTIETGSDGTVQSVAAGTPVSPGIRVITYCDSLNRMISAGDSVSAFRSEYQNDRVRIVGIGFVNWLFIELLKHPWLSAGISLTFLLLAAFLVYYYVRRRQMSRGGFQPGGGGSK